jgi:DNA-directed RNA polymerase specialized sigma24 family protein
MSHLDIDARRRRLKASSQPRASALEIAANNALTRARRVQRRRPLLSHGQWPAWGVLPTTRQALSSHSCRIGNVGRP